MMFSKKILQSAFFTNTTKMYQQYFPIIAWINFNMPYITINYEAILASESQDRVLNSVDGIRHIYLQG